MNNLIRLSEISHKITRVETAVALLDLLAVTAEDLGFCALHLAFAGPRQDVLFTTQQGRGGAKGLHRTRMPLRHGQNLLMRLAQRRTNAFVWSDALASDHIAKKYRPQLAAYGVQAGVSVPMHLGRCYIGCLSAGIAQGSQVDAAQVDTIAIVARLAMLQAITLDDPSMRPAAPRVNALSAITPQQVEILQWVAEGKTNREIAIITNTRHRTVDYHVQEILKKLGVNARAQAVAMYINASRKV